MARRKKIKQSKAKQSKIKQLWQSIKKQLKRFWDYVCSFG
jgi:hypothetical protein